MAKQDIHSTAVVSADAEIGEEVSIGPYSVVDGNTVIGNGCKIGPHVSILEHTKIGPRCEIHAGASLGGIPQDAGFKGTESYVDIGAGCIIREHVTIHRGTGEGSTTRVGSGCFLMACSHVAHNCVLDNDVIMANNAMLAGHVHVGEKVFISGGAGIHQFARVGRLALVGGNSVCSKDVPPFCMVEPCTWNGVKGMNIIGMRRAGMSADQRVEVKRVFKLLYNSDLNTAQALEQIDSLEGDVAAEMARFVRESERGIC
jgi:UDP-N-acetylglucosamine acyltransferase